MIHGKVADIDFKKITEQLLQQGAVAILKNTAKLNPEEFQEIKISSHATTEILEEQVIKEHLQQIKLFDYETEFNLTKTLLTTLNTSKREGETMTDFQKRVETEISRLLNV